MYTIANIIYGSVVGKKAYDWLDENGPDDLKDLGIQKLKLMTNNPKKIVGLKGYDLEVVERVPLEIEPNEINKKYLKTKREKLGHFLSH